MFYYVLLTMFYSYVLYNYTVKPSKLESHTFWGPPPLTQQG